DRKVAGAIVWGGGARTWFERMLAFERNRRERSSLPGERIDQEMKRVTAWLYHALVEGHDAARIAREHPALAEAATLVRGLEGETLYGRPLAFHRQAQQRDCAAAWSRVDAPALVLFGEYDWYEDAAGHELVARLVSRRHPEHTR